MAFFNDKQTTTSKQQIEQDDITKKQSQLIENIKSVDDVDLQHNMLDKFMPYTHKSLVAGITTAIVKTRNLVRQYRMFMFIILLSLVFHIINFVGFQNVLAKKISEADIKAIIQAVRSNG